MSHFCCHLKGKIKKFLELATKILLVKITGRRKYDKKRKPQEIFISQGFGGEGGIRTPGTLLTYTRFPGEHLRPLRHLSMIHLLFYIRQPLPNCLRIIISYPCRNTSKIYLFVLMNFSRYFLIIFFYSGQNKATDSWGWIHSSATRTCLPRSRTFARYDKSVRIRIQDHDPSHGTSLFSSPIRDDPHSFSFTAGREKRRNRKEHPFGSKQQPLSPFQNEVWLAHTC